MSSDIAIRASNLTKVYRIYEHPFDRVRQLLAQSGKKHYREFTALDGVSFEIRKGETVGIIGRNGSGKSTLLQLICGIRKPTSGVVEVNGRVSALLELGSGFHPEFSGRENVFLQGAIQGLSRDDMEARFDDIARFADIGEFIDQPVKMYSSGMFLRLAFAVAVNVDPNILVVDEALAVGDEVFQRKCFNRLGRLKDQGTALLFVSHSAQAIIELCDRALLLEHGHLLLDHQPKTALGAYQKLLFASPASQSNAQDEIRRLAQTNGATLDQLPYDKASLTLDKAHFEPNFKAKSSVIYEPHGATISDPHITNGQDICVNVLVLGEEYLFRYDVKFESNAEDVRFGMMIKTVTGFELGGLVSSRYRNFRAGTMYRVELPFLCRLLPGTYFLNAGVHGTIDQHSTYLHRILDAVVFRVQGKPNYARTGVVDFSPLTEAEQT